MRALELLTTEGCHLCELAEPILVQGVDPHYFTVDIVDIAYDDQLIDTYATRIPVLVDSSSGAELGWPFDAQTLADFLRGLAL